jgi:hypothetical protein
LKKGDIAIIPNLKEGVKCGASDFTAKVVRGDDVFDAKLSLGELTFEEREIILAGCLINYYGKK